MGCAWELGLHRLSGRMRLLRKWGHKRVDCNKRLAKGPGKGKKGGKVKSKSGVHALEGEAHTDTEGTDDQCDDQNGLDRAWGSDTDGGEAWVYALSAGSADEQLHVGRLESVTEEASEKEGSLSSGRRAPGDESPPSPTGSGPRAMVAGHRGPLVHGRHGPG